MEQESQNGQVITPLFCSMEKTKEYFQITEQKQIRVWSQIFLEIGVRRLSGVLRIIMKLEFM